MERWILPLNGLNSGTVYEGRPVGNSPELMCLDSHLFNDVDQAMSMHVAITHDLPESDPKKFTCATPTRQAMSYFRLLVPKLGGSSTGLVMKYADEEGALSSSRIIEDAKAIWAPPVAGKENVLLCIREAQGVVIPGLGSRSGRRLEVGGERGGSRVKGAAPKQRWFHEDAKDRQRNFAEYAIAKIERLAYI